MQILYFLITQVYYFAIKIAALFNPKAKLAVEGRKGIFKKLAAQNFQPNQWIWLHCASLGEFEQGRPIIEKIKVNHPSQKILLTFFSPSGYEIRKDYEHADFVCYLPFDSHSNAKQFLKLVQPRLAIFVKYEFWHFYLKELKQVQIPTVLVSAIFRKEQVFFKWYGGFFKEMLSAFRQIFVQDSPSAELLNDNGFAKVAIAGDTRIDRVLDIASAKKSFPKIEVFLNEKFKHRLSNEDDAPQMTASTFSRDDAQNGGSFQKTLIIGSSWIEDEKVLFPFLNQKLPDDWKVIIAPHDIGESRLKEIESICELPHIRYSHLTKVSEAKVLIIDNIGMLSSLYQYGTIAYIGGGFGSGIHNTLEPIAFGLPVIFGSKFQKFREAKELVKSGGGFSISNQGEFEEVFERLLSNRENASTAAMDYVKKNKGATEQVYQYLKDELLD